MKLPLEVLKVETKKLFYVACLTEVYVTPAGEIFLDKGILDPMGRCDMLPPEEDLGDGKIAVAVEYTLNQVKCKILMPRDMLTINTTLEEGYNPTLTSRKRDDILLVSGVWWSRKHYVEEHDENSRLNKAIAEKNSAVLDQDYELVAHMRGVVQEIVDDYFESYCRRIGVDVPLK